MRKDLGLKLEALLWMAFFQGSLALFSFRRVTAWRERFARVRSASGEPREWIRRVRYAIRRANGRVPGAKCLADAFTAQVMLARRGVTSELKIGVKKEGDALDAHAWLEREGRCIVGEGQLEEFTRLEGLDA